MLQLFFKYPGVIRRLRRGPFGPHMDPLAEHLSRSGYAHISGQNMLSLLSRVSRFAEEHQIHRAEDVDDDVVDRFLDARVGGPVGAHAARLFVRRFRAFVTTGHLPRRATHQATALSIADEALVAKYDAHLIELRGLRPSTRVKYRRMARRFLSWLRGRKLSLEALTPPHILDYVSVTLRLYNSGGWKGQVCTGTRSFLRFLDWIDASPAALDAAVPSPISRRLTTCPQHLPWHQVQRLIASLDTSRPGGLRDMALLLVIAELGLRSGEVCALELRDFDWGRGAVLIRHAKNGTSRELPLPDASGQAVMRYLLEARPQSKHPQVFLRERAPKGPLASGAVMRVVAKSLRQAGIEAPKNGAHMLRHSLATRMINTGSTLKEIADILGHRDIQSTVRYAKVDVVRLAEVAMPFGLQTP